MKIANLLTKTMDYLSDAVVITDTQQRIIYFNPVARTFISGNPARPSLAPQQAGGSIAAAGNKEEFLGKKLSEVFKFVDDGSGTFLEIPGKFTDEEIIKVLQGRK